MYEAEWVCCSLEIMYETGWECWSLEITQYIDSPFERSPHYSQINSSPPGQNGCHFADNIFNCIFVCEKFCILFRISLKFVPKGPTDNNSALVLNGSGDGLTPNRWQAITWSNTDPVHWHIYVALWGGELTLYLQIILAARSHMAQIIKSEQVTENRNINGQKWLKFCV